MLLLLLARTTRSVTSSQILTGALPNRLVGAIVSVMPDEPQGSGNSPDEPSDAVTVSPQARRIAEQLGVDVALVTGSGPGGEVVPRDVAAAAQASVGSIAEPAERPATATSPDLDAALLSLSLEVRLDAVLELHGRLELDWPAPQDRRDRVVPTVPDLVVRAAAIALVEHPDLNVAVLDDGVRPVSAVHIGLAAGTPGGPVGVVVRHADRLSLDALAAESARLVDAGEGRGLEGCTFSVSALGRGAVDTFTPAIRTPNAAALGMGRIRDGVRWEDDRPVRSQVLTVSLSVDQRAVDPAGAAGFLTTVGSLLEQPLRLLS